MKIKLFICFIILVTAIYIMCCIVVPSNLPAQEPTITKPIKYIKPTPTQIEKYSMCNAERHAMCMKMNLIVFMDKKLDEVIKHINKNFKDELKLIDSVPVSSVQDYYIINSYKSLDGSILILYTDNDICVAYDWKKKEAV